jgi:hypothetical protein
LYNDIGTTLAVVGSIISIIGTLTNNLYHKHLLAMQVWAVSNIILLVWAVGNSIGWWDGGLSGIALAIMYSVFTISGVFGLITYAKGIKSE